MLTELNWIETQVQIQFNTKIVKVCSDHKVTADNIAWNRYYIACVVGRKKDTGRTPRIMFQVLKERHLQPRSVMTPCYLWQILKHFAVSWNCHDVKNPCLSLSYSPKGTPLPATLRWESLLTKIQQVHSYISKSERNKVATTQPTPWNHVPRSKDEEIIGEKIAKPPILFCLGHYKK